MPMLDVYIPTGALDPDAERTLIGEVTDILLRAEGADPSNDAVRQISWAFLHRPEVFVAGSPSGKPHYRVVASVPEGQLNGAVAKQQLIADVTDAFVRAEGGADDVRGRVWVFPMEIPEGHWGAGGQAVGLADVLRAAGVRDKDKARHVADRRIAESRQERGLHTA